MPDVALITPDRRFIERLKTAGGETLSKCYQCAACSAVCNLSPTDHPFPRKEMLYSQWGLRDRLTADPDVWLCHQCNDCSVSCPRGAKPGEVLAAIRSYTFEHFAFPGFMGRLLASPAGLPLLLLIPFILISALIWIHTGGEFTYLMNQPVEFGAFIPDGYIEMLFIGGNVLIFLFAAVGLLSFYRGMQAAYPGAPKMGFIPAVMATVIEIITHKRFGKCDANRYRTLAHLLTMFGFFGAMATAGLALIAMVMFHFGPPIPLSHPIKWLGNASGLAMIVGLSIIILQRGFNAGRAGKAWYGNWLFIWTVMAVTVTGMSLQFWRLAEMPSIAYPAYFIHLLVVFFLLWYAPYSQLGHMFYRTLAMVFATSIQRQPRQLSAAA